MKAEYLDDEEMPEFDFSNGVRGAFANRWTPEEREAILRDSAYGTVRAMTQYAGEQLQALEAALFTYLVLAANETSHQAANTAAGLLKPHASSVSPPLKVRGIGSAFDADFASRLNKLASEREWLENQPPLAPYAGPGSFKAVVDRLKAIYDEARALKARVDELIQAHLARNGLSEQEIERKTEETARLWLAA
jgi:hypothetical protein